MNPINELSRLNSLAPLPQGLAWQDGTLWMGSMDTKIVYLIDPSSWTIQWLVQAPGTPFGITVIGDELRVLCGETEEDNRYIRRLMPGRGFDSAFKQPCPEDTGSQLGFDGQQLHVSQWYNKRVLALNKEGGVEKIYNSPHGIAGQCIVDGSIYLITTDAEETTEYFLTRIDQATGQAEDIATVPFQARALAFDGEAFWTNHRDANQTVRFAKPDHK